MSKIKRQLLFKDFFIDTFDSTLNDKNPRTGIALADGKNWNFSYDNMGQVTGAMLNNSASLLNTYSYNYDLIGNRIQATKDNDITSYNSNIVNQYTQINSAVPTYDQDGNMLTNGSWNYTWNGENRMTVAQNAARKVEFSYDYMGRCFERKEYTASSNDSWNLDKTVYIVYDDYKQIAEYVNEELHQQYAWDSAGLDTVAFMSKSNSVYMYWTDGNKNVLKLFDTAGEQASYSYDPFGKVTTAEGSLAADNPFRFSCEYHNDITGLVEYIYRKYDPSLGRWINRDPIEEQGGMNLYAMVSNSISNNWDDTGLVSYREKRIKQNKCCHKNTVLRVSEDIGTNGKNCCIKLVKICITSRNLHQNICIGGDCYSFGIRDDLSYWMGFVSRFFNSGETYDKDEYEKEEKCFKVKKSIATSLKYGMNLQVGERYPYHVTNIGTWGSNCRAYSQIFYNEFLSKEYSGDLPECL